MSQDVPSYNHFGKMERSLPTCSDTEVVGDLLVLVFWLRQRDIDGIAATIIVDAGNQNDDNPAMHPRSVVSTRHHQSSTKSL